MKKCVIGAIYIRDFVAVTLTMEKTMHCRHHHFLSLSGFIDLMIKIDIYYQASRTLHIE